MHALSRLAAAAAALPAAGSVALAQQGGPMMYGFGYDNWGWTHMLTGLFLMVLFWGGLIALVFLAIRWLGSGRGPESAREPARRAVDILEERFARGEIDKQEFLDRKAQLTG